jgi:hypothetical protein
MMDVKPCFAALTEENKSNFRSLTTVISKFSLIVPFSIYWRGVPFPIEQDPYVGMSAVRCFRIGDVVDITEREAPESKYIHKSFAWSCGACRRANLASSSFVI